MRKLKRPVRIHYDKRGNPYIRLHGKKVLIKSDLPPSVLNNVIIKNIIGHKSTTKRPIRNKQPQPPSISTTTQTINDLIAERAKAVERELKALSLDASTQPQVIPQQQPPQQQPQQQISQLQNELNNLKLILQQQPQQLQQQLSQIETSVQKALTLPQQLIQDVNTAIKALPQQQEQSIIPKIQQIMSDYEKKLQHQGSQIVNLEKSISDIVNIGSEQVATFSKKLKENEDKLREIEERKKRVTKEVEAIEQELKRKENELKIKEQELIEAQYKVMVIEDPSRRTTEKEPRINFDRKARTLRLKNIIVKHNIPLESGMTLNPDPNKAPKIKTSELLSDATGIYVRNPASLDEKHFIAKFDELPDELIAEVLSNADKVGEVMEVYKRSQEIKPSRVEEVKQSKQEEVIEEQQQPSIEATQEEQKQEGSGNNKLCNGLYDDEINNIMSQFSPQGYKGVYSIDEIPKLFDLIESYNKVSFIMNTEPSNIKEGHWVAIYIDPIDDMSIEYFDSYGRCPPKQFLNLIKPIVDKLSPDFLLKFKVNKVIQQKVNTSTCGLMAMRFLINRYEGKSFKEATGYTDLNKSEKNAIKLGYKFGLL